MQVRVAPVGRSPHPIRPDRRISRAVPNATPLPWLRPAPKATLSHRLSIAMTEVAATSPFPAKPRCYQSGNSQVVPDGWPRFLRLVRPGNQKVHPATGRPSGGSYIRQASRRKLEGNFRRGLCESGIRRVGASACRLTGALSRPRIRRSSTNTRAHGLT